MGGFARSIGFFKTVLRDKWEGVYTMNATVGDNRKKVGISVVMLVASVALLMGLTFAWFTSTVTNSGNQMQAGTLGIQLNDGKTEPIMKSKAQWEPGYSEKAEVKVSNTGSLWLKYAIGVANVKTSGTNTGDITKVLDVYVVNKAKDQVAADDLTAASGNFIGTVADLSTDGENSFTGHKAPYLAPKGASDEVAGTTYDDNDTFTLVVKMDEQAGNEYQGQGATFDIVARASQATVETDGFGNNAYDQDADFNKTVSIDPVQFQKLHDGGLKSNTTYVLQKGNYTTAQVWTRGAKNVSIVGGEGVNFPSGLTIGFHMGQDWNIEPKTDSTLKVSGLNVTGALTVQSMDQTVVVDGNTVSDGITVSTFKLDGMQIDVTNNTVTGGQNGVLFFNPSASNYTLKVTGNSFRNAKSHVIYIQGGGQNGTPRTAKDIRVTDNEFGKPADGKAVFKIWNDTKFAPQEISSADGLTADAKSLAQSILDGHNKYLASGTKFDFYGYGFDSLS